MARDEQVDGRTDEEVFAEMAHPLDREHSDEMILSASLSVDERIRLLDRLCREMTHIAATARRVR